MKNFVLKGRFYNDPDEEGEDSDDSSSENNWDWDTSTAEESGTLDVDAPSGYGVCED